MVAIQSHDVVFLIQPADTFNTPTATLASGLMMQGSAHGGHIVDNESGRQYYD